VKRGATLAAGREEALAVATEARLKVNMMRAEKAWLDEAAREEERWGLYKLNAVDPQLERRLVSTLGPIK
jgi:hypothetical protein